MTGLRERKRDQTRDRIVNAAVTLFGELGFEQTSVARIAESADVSQRTFFRYFPTKDAVLFADTDDLLTRAREVIRSAEPDADPIEVLIAALRQRSAPLDSPVVATRLRLIESVPSVAGSAYRLQAEAERVLAEDLASALPGRIDADHAAVLIGALSGASVAAARRGLRVSEAQLTRTAAAIAAALPAA